MIVVAVVRISGFVYRHAFDEGWVYLWQQIESCVSVSTISLTAFRIMFVAGTSRREQSPRRWSEKGAWKWRGLAKRDQGGTGGLDDVTIPGATLTGMATLIRGARTQAIISILNDDIEEWPLRRLRARLASGGEGSVGVCSLHRVPSNNSLEVISLDRHEWIG